ncbi:MAG: serine hydrolase [Candidatus Omnitrophota bacterium]|jgi:beta-lactamase class A
MTKRRIFFGLFFCVCFISFVFCLYKAYSGLQDVKKRQAALEKRKIAWSSLERAMRSKLNSFSGNAGIIVEDLKMGWRISLNEDKLFPSASMVKIPIMAACLRAVRDKKISLGAKMVLKASHKTEGSGVLKNKPVGSKFTVDKLIELMITKSDNTAANMLIGLLGFEYLNDFFKSEGLEHTNLSRKMMDFRHRKQGVENYTTAEDISFILEKIYRKRFINRRVSEKCLGLLLNQKVNDRIPRKLPQDVLVAHKTGLERNVCHDAGIVFTDQGHFLICVLTKSRSGTRKVKEFISDISLYIYNTYERMPVS